MRPHFLARLILLSGLFLATPCMAAKRFNVSTFSQIDVILKSTRVMTYPDVVLVLRPDSFQDAEEAQLMCDVLRLAMAWGFWIDSNGQVVNDFNLRARVFFVGVNPVTDEMKRMKPILTWFKERFTRNPELSDLDSMILKRLPSGFEFLRTQMTGLLGQASDAQTTLNFEKSPMFRQAFYGFQSVINDEATDGASAASLKRCESLFFPRPAIRSLPSI